ncbi:MAG: hypothetical protein ACK5MT_15105 [Actinomycetales bacterium]
MQARLSRTPAPIAVIGLVVIGLVATGLAVAAVTLPRLADRSDTGSQGAGASPTPPGPSASAQEMLPQRLPVLTSFVAQELGEDFTTTPQVIALPEADFEARHDQALDRERSQSSGVHTRPEHDHALTAYALGLSESSADSDGTQPQGAARSSAVTGWYDTSSRTIWLRGQEWTLDTEVTLVHELAHALTDQQLGLDRLMATTNDFDESAAAARAMIEGQASVVEGDWVAAQSPTYQRDYADGRAATAQAVTAEGGSAGTFAETIERAPSALGETALLQMSSGTRTALLDAAARPPRTLEQVAGRERWLASDPRLADPVAVPRPGLPSDAELRDSGTIGSYTLQLLVLDPQRRNDFSRSGQVPLDGTWRGDSYTTYTRSGQACTEVTALFDTPSAADDFAGSVVLAFDGQVVSSGSAVELRGCRPIPEV